MNTTQSSPFRSKPIPSQAKNHTREIAESISEWTNNGDKYIFKNTGPRDPLLMLLVKPNEMKKPSWEGLFSILKFGGHKRLTQLVIDLKQVFLKLIPENMCRIDGYYVKKVEEGHVAADVLTKSKNTELVNSLSIALEDFMNANQFREWIIKWVTYYFESVQKMIAKELSSLRKEAETRLSQFRTQTKNDISEKIVLVPYERVIIADEDCVFE